MKMSQFSPGVQINATDKNRIYRIGIKSINFTCKGKRRSHTDSMIGSLRKAFDEIMKNLF